MLKWKSFSAKCFRMKKKRKEQKCENSFGEHSLSVLERNLIKKFVVAVAIQPFPNGPFSDFFPLIQVLCISTSNFFCIFHWRGYLILRIFFSIYIQRYEWNRLNIKERCTYILIASNLILLKHMKYSSNSNKAVAIDLMKCFFLSLLKVLNKLMSISVSVSVSVFWVK